MHERRLIVTVFGAALRPVMADCEDFTMDTGTNEANARCWHTSLLG